MHLLVYDGLMVFIVALIAMVTLPAPFGGAEAGAISLDEGMTIEVIVEVDGPYTIVLAQPFSSSQQLPPTALSDLGDGSWGGFVQLPSAANWNIVFDAFESDGTTVRSDATTMLELGVDRVVVSGEPVVPQGEGLFSGNSVWLMAAVFLILGALGALAWWTFSGDDSTT